MEKNKKVNNKNQEKSNKKNNNKSISAVGSSSPHSVRSPKSAHGK